MGKMVDLGLQPSPSPSAPALPCQAKSARELDPLSPPGGLSLCGEAKGLAKKKTGELVAEVGVVTAQ